MTFNFDLKGTAIFQAIKRERFPLFKFANFFKKLFFFLFILFLFLFGLSFLKLFPRDLALGSLIVSLTISMFFWQFALFFNLKVKNPELKVNLSEAVLKPGEYNFAEFLNLESGKIVLRTIKFCKKRKISEISSTALLYSSLMESPKISFIFLRLGLDVINFQEKLKNYLEKLKRKEKFVESFSQDFQDAIMEAAKVANEREHKRIGEREILVGVSRVDPFFRKILIELNLKEEDIENITLWLDILESRVKDAKKFWRHENLSKYGSLGKDWAMGYTVTLDKFAVDWRNIVKKWVFKEIVGHQKEIKRVERILARAKTNNVLLVGEPGTGKKGIIESLARKSYLGTTLPELNYQRVVELDMISLLSQIQNPEEVEATLDKIFQEVVLAGNIILVIDELHNFVALETPKPGAIDISGILAKYLHFPQFRFIGITTYVGLHRSIEQNPSLLEFFGKVEVLQISELETIRVLKNLALELERKYKVFIAYPTIREIVNLTARYMPSLPFPKKAIDILEEVMVYVSSAKEKVVLPHHVAEIVSTKTEIPVGKIGFEEKGLLLNLEELIHERIINQEEAVKGVSDALRRARAGITKKKRPMGVFLFLGPTGVGKTETSKALAKIYFDSEEKMIRLDMSEFQAISDVPRLIGAPGEEGLLTTPVRENPFSLLLLDEIEKAHPNILNLFLQVFDEGHITDGQGRKVSFTNAIIICTSNAGAEIIWEDIKLDKKLDIIRDELLSHLFKKGIFRPEFINRFDAALIFRPLTKENLLDIAQLMLNSLKKNLKEKGIEFVISEPLKEKIVKLSYKPVFGAREMRRVIQDKVENVLAKALLGDKLKRGDRVEISPQEFKLTINPG